jgi:lysophospholipase L1-like esterase
MNVKPMRAREVRKNLTVGLALALLAFAGVDGVAQELLNDTNFVAGPPVPAVKGWKLAGGTVQLPAGSQAGVVLLPERTMLADGSEGWQGRLTVPAGIEVLPGRRYRFQCEVRGQGSFRLGLSEYGWKHSARVVSCAEKRFELSAQPQVLAFDYAPTVDGVAFVRPYLQVEGWVNRAELRSVSFSNVLETGEVSIQAGHFLAAPGEAVTINLNATSYPVKLLLYGPSGESGPGGSMGGAGAFVDHFKTSREQEGKAGESATVPFPLPPDAIEGAYRLVAVEPASGAMAVTRFNVMPKQGQQEMLDLVQHVDLPKGSRLVFLGDSLTANFPGRNYVSILERAFRWRFGDDVEVLNAGVGGNTIAAMAARLEKDVLEKKPTHVFVFEGANSCKRPYTPATGQLGAWALPEPRYEAAWRDVLTRLTQQKIKVVVMTMAPGDREILDAVEATARAFGEGKNFWCDPETVRQVVAIQKRLAREFGADVIDMNSSLNAAMQARVRSGGRQYVHVDDGVHISEYGSREVAKAVLRYAAGRQAVPGVHGFEDGNGNMGHRLSRNVRPAG